MTGERPAHIRTFFQALFAAGVEVMAEETQAVAKWASCMLGALTAGMPSSPPCRT